MASEWTNRANALDWAAVEAEMENVGVARAGSVLAHEECRALAALYDDEALFRSRVIMARHGFGRGEYRYFGNPLPPPVAGLRAALYPHLVPIANRWNALLKEKTRFPETHGDYLARCHAAGQTKPTPLLLRYRIGDYNCLHQDVYGEHLFPLQAAVLLSRPQRDFAGGEFLVTEQRPRMQSRAEVVGLDEGDCVIFAVRDRPVRGARGYYRVKHRHGVSRLRAGQRFMLGIIFHDAA